MEALSVIRGVHVILKVTENPEISVGTRMWKDDCRALGRLVSKCEGCGRQVTMASVGGAMV